MGDVAIVEQKHGNAVANLEYAAELFREIGDTTHEIKSLDRLENSYDILQDEASCAEVRVRRKVILDTIQDAVAKSKPSNSESGGNVSPSNSSSQIFSSFLHMFNMGGDDQKESILKQVEDGKRYLKHFVKARANVNEQYMQRHLMQVRFDDLPFASIEARVLNSGVGSIDKIEEMARKFYMSIREYVYVATVRSPSPASNNEGTFDPFESPGSFKHALEEWERSNVRWGEVAREKADEIQQTVLLPLAKVKEVYRTLCEHFIEQRQATEKRVAIASKLLDQELVALHKAHEKLSELNVQIEEQSKQSSSKRSLSGSMNDLLGKTKTKLREAQGKVKQEVQSCTANVAIYQQRLRASKGALIAVRKRTCQELEMIEQSRMEIVVDLLSKFVETQQELLDQWHKCTLHILKYLKNVNSDSDIRTYCNRNLIHSVLLGKTTPSALFCSPLNALRTNSSVNSPRKALSPKSQTSTGSHHFSRTETISEGVEDGSDSLTPNVPEVATVDAPPPPGIPYRKTIDRFMDRLSSSMEVDAGVKEDFQVVRQMCEDFHQRSCREYFLLCLNRFRSSKTKVGKAIMDDLVLLLIAFLDAVYIQGDVKAAKMALILSETFYTEAISPGKLNDDTALPTEETQEETENRKERENRFYIQDGIKDHGIWRSDHFWEETFYLAVREEIHRNVCKTINDGTASRRRSLSTANYKNIVYGQIGSSAFNMVSVGLPTEQVQRFVQRMCLGNDILKEDVDALLTNLLSVEE
uniref:SBF1/SBF2 domain-containing protein n=1 Tax=Mucochytrium quahogii TaxID=96639 RepID=A0A7S2RP16_9STRA